MPISVSLYYFMLMPWLVPKLVLCLWWSSANYLQLTDFISASSRKTGVFHSLGESMLEGRMVDRQMVLLIVYAPPVSVAHLERLWHHFFLAAAGSQIHTSFVFHRFVNVNSP